MTHICVGKLTIIGSDNGLSPGRRQAIIWTNAGILLIGPLGTNFSEILIGIQTFSFKKMHSKMSSGKWRPFCHGLNVLMKGFYGCIGTISKSAMHAQYPVDIRNYHYSDVIMSTMTSSWWDRNWIGIHPMLAASIPSLVPISIFGWTRF